MSLIVRRAEALDIPAILNLLAQVDMVHHNGRPDLFKGPATKYNAAELESILADADPVACAQGHAQTKKLRPSPDMLPIIEAAQKGDLDALKAAPSEEICVCLNTGASPCVITPAEGEQNFLYMILPVRLKAE